jgi:tetratricopeptide (TPR) repeat protein
LLFAATLVFDSCKNESKQKPVSVSKNATLNELDSIIKADPKNADAYYRRANYHLSLMHLGEATTDINKAIELDSTQAVYYVTVADLHLITNNSGKCKAALDKSLSVDSNQIDALLKMSELYLYVNDNVKSIKYSNKVLDQEKTNSKAYFLIGMNQKALKDTVKAVLAFQEAINNNQDDYNSYLQLGLIYAAKKNPKALNYYDNAANIQPKNPEPYYNKGVFFHIQKDFKRAGMAYTQALQLNNNYKNALFNFSLLLIDSEKNYAQAKALLEKYVQIEPDFARAHFLFALCLQNTGSADRAKEEYKRAATLEPDNVEFANAAK